MAVKKTCPRCGEKFSCKRDSVRKCDCAKVAMTPEVRMRLDKLYSDCLCLRCLREAAESGRLSPT